MIVTRTSTSTAAAAAAFVAHVLELLPLLFRHHLLQTLVRLPADLIHARLRFAAQGTQLIAGVGKDLLDLRLLIRVQIQTL